MPVTQSDSDEPISYSAPCRADTISPDVGQAEQATTGTLLGVIDLVGSPESVSLAREFVRRKLGDGHPALDDVTLLVSEVVTNAVVHSDSKNGGKVTLALADCYDLVHVDVADAGSRTAPRVCGGILSEGGRGLMLVDLVSDRWDVHDDDTGRTVWFEVGYRRETPRAALPFPAPRQPT
ncbi:ATP-binding protein [Sphaerisporangium sp. NPDC088356]|uniref:ATP-binding protein n=1 Tax=Sphaerisporangium sp. NPDC088356 TaxID=3154871 RepID=UPI0034364742